MRSHNAKIDRNIDIFILREGGETFSSIAKKYKITPQRARQIHSDETKRRWRATPITEN